MDNSKTNVIQKIFLSKVHERVAKKLQQAGITEKLSYLVFRQEATTIKMLHLIESTDNLIEKALSSGDALLAKNLVIVENAKIEKLIMHVLKQYKKELV